MLTTEDVTLAFKSNLALDYKDNLDRIFFFNHNQYKYIDRINKSIDEFSMPVLKEEEDRVSITFREEWMGQTLHILDGIATNSELVGVIMYTRKDRETITIVHFVLHEECSRIFKTDRINIALLVYQGLTEIFETIKGISKVHIYYTDKILTL